MNLAPKISLLQLFILAFHTSFGVSMATLPRSVAAASKEDMWLAVIVGGVCFLFAVWATVKLAAYFPEDTTIEITCKLLGPRLGVLINAFLVTIVLLIPAVSMRTFGVGIQSFLLESTPAQIIVAITIMLLIYGAQHGLPPLVRMQEFNFIPTQFLFLMLLLFGFSAIDTKNYLPFLAGGIIPVIKGAIPVWYAYTGPEIVIGMVYPFITSQKGVIKAGVVAVVALMTIYTLITIIIQGIIGAKEAEFLLVPTLTAFRNVEIPDTLIERLDGYFAILWIPIYFFCMLNWVYMACFGASRMMRLESSRPLVVLLGPIVYYIIMSISNYQSVIILNTWLNMAFIAWGLVIVPLLLLLAWRRAKQAASQ